MKTGVVRALWLLVLAGSLALPAAGAAAEKAGGSSRGGDKAAGKDPAAQQENRKAGETRDDSETVPPVIYRPPLRGAPMGRIAGGTRGILDEFPVLGVLTPDHAALTLHPAPTLHWFLSKPSKFATELTITESRGIEPVLEVRVPQPPQPGIQRFRLADHGVSLETGVEYRWFVALVVDPEHRSRDILAFGAIKRVDPPAGLQQKLDAATPGAVPGLYAEAGFWYDALDALSDLVETSADAVPYRKQRASLLEQVGLGLVAEHDRTTGSQGAN